MGRGSRLAFQVTALALFAAACQTTAPLSTESPDPPFPHLSKLPGEEWQVYRVIAYRSTDPTYAYNPYDRRTEIWLEYRLTLESKDRVQLTLTCGQWQLPDNSEGCGQGLLIPNEKVWTKEGRASGEQLWVYSKRTRKNGLGATFWHIDSREAR